MAVADTPMIANGEPVALALGAGGARGLAQIGVIEALQALGDGVRRLGVEVPEDVIVESDLVLPDVDVSLADVRELLKSTSEYYGLIPDADSDLNEGDEESASL